MENRETIIIPEKKKKIENIKKKYNNLQMQDKTAEKIIRLETVNNVLTIASGLAGVITVIDLFIPDPVLGLDEAALVGITTLLSTSTRFINNKINDLAEKESTQVSIEEVSNLTNIIKGVVQNAKNKIGSNLKL